MHNPLTKEDGGIVRRKIGTAAHRSGTGAADPYKNFVWNVERGAQRIRNNGRDASKILSGLDRMRD